MAQDPITNTQAAPAAVQMPNKTQIVPVVKDAIAVAVDAVNGSTTSSADTVTAVNALAQGLTSVLEMAAATQGPLASVAADAVAPEVSGVVASALYTIMRKLGMETTTEFARLETWLTKTL